MSHRNQYPAEQSTSRHNDASSSTSYTRSTTSNSSYEFDSVTSSALNHHLQYPSSPEEARPPTSLYRPDSNQRRTMESRVQEEEEDPAILYLNSMSARLNSVSARGEDGVDAFTASLNNGNTTLRGRDSSLAASSTARQTNRDNQNNASSQSQQSTAAAATVAASAAAESASPPSIAANTTRAPRQAAISCRERISAAIATDGMADEHVVNGDIMNNDNDDDDAKPRAKHRKKRTQPPKVQPAKRRKVKQQGNNNHKNYKINEETTSTTTITCCICLEPPTPQDLASISGCSHPFCFGCIERWSDRENTCPLCKARFYKIEKVHHDASDTKEGEGGQGCASAKKVTMKDQRSDAMSFMGNMDGLFGGGMGIETGATVWPTHIAQLLFSGLGASTLGTHGMNSGGVYHQRSVDNALTRAASSTGAGPLAAPTATGGMLARHPPRVETSRRTLGYASRGTGGESATPSASDIEPFSEFLDRVHAHRQREQQQRLQRMRDNVDARTSSSVYSTTAVLGSSSHHHHHTSAFPLMPPFQHSTTTTTLTTTTESSVPWMTSQSSSIHSHMAAPSFNTLSSITYPSLSPPSLFLSPAGSASAAPLDVGGSGISPNPFASIDMTQREEEEDILSALSPTSYLQRLHREMDNERSGTSSYQQYSVATASRNPTSLDPPALNPSSLRRSAAAVGRNSSNANIGGSSGRCNEAGRSAETALEIDDSDSDDDDVVEVIAVEAMM